MHIQLVSLNGLVDTLQIMRIFCILYQVLSLILSLLDTNKTSGPDNIHPYILKNCANEIAPILQVIFTQSEYYHPIG